MPPASLPNLQKFTLDELAQFTKEGQFDSRASKSVALFYAGRDNVHNALKYVLSRATISIVMNMFGYDDDDLNAVLMEKVRDPSILTVITLDKSQAGGKHEASLLAIDKKDLAIFNTHFVIGESATHQISHTKGGVVDGKVAWEGSTNWSSSGEGTFVVKGNGQAGGPGYKAQNNTNSFIIDPSICARFQAELISEHLTAKSQAK